MTFTKILKNTIQRKNVKYRFSLIMRLLICLVIKNLLNPVVTKLEGRSRKLNISLVFITQSYFAVPKNVRLNSTHYLL